MILRQILVQERIVGNVDRDERGCWNWRGALTSGGYGTMNLKAEGIGTAHRASWFAYREHPGSLYVLHRCDNRSCCNPAHLFLGTPADNSRDMVSKGRHISPMTRRHHCPRGHPYDGRNINGARICKRCASSASRKSQIKKEMFA